MNIVRQIASLLFLATIVSGDQTYNSSQICCKGLVLDRNDSNEYYSYCCGKELLEYRYDDESVKPQCCDDVPYKNPESKDYQCCGKQLYNQQESFCSLGNILIEIPPANSAKGEIKLCGKEFYNPKIQVCCDDALHPYDKNQYCCGEKVYDWSTSLCTATNKVIDVGNSTNQGICGETIYNTTKSICCYVEKMADDEKVEYIPTILSLNDKDPVRGGCCGTTVYNYMKEVCCSGVPLPKSDPDLYYECCGAELLAESNSELCLNGEVLSKSNPDEYACGSQLYNQTEYFCFNNTLVKHAANEISCYGAQQGYNPETQICTSDSVITLEAEDIKYEKYSYCEKSIYF